MAAYALVEIDVIDLDTYARYREVAPAIVAAFGGTSPTRGGATETGEGTGQPQRLIILAFPSLDRLHAFDNAARLCGRKGSAQALNHEHHGRLRGHLTVSRRPTRGRAEPDRGETACAWLRSGRWTTG